VDRRLLRIADRLLIIVVRLLVMSRIENQLGVNPCHLHHMGILEDHRRGSVDLGRDLVVQEVHLQATKEIILPVHHLEDHLLVLVDQEDLLVGLEDHRHLMHMVRMVDLDLMAQEVLPQVSVVPIQGLVGQGLICLANLECEDLHDMTCLVKLTQGGLHLQGLICMANPGLEVPLDQACMEILAQGDIHGLVWTKLVQGVLARGLECLAMLVPEVLC